MTYITDELRGIDTILSDMRKKIEKLECDMAKTITRIDELRGIDTAISDFNARLGRLEQEIAELQKNTPTRWATERQKAFINDICTTLNIPPPEGFPNRLTFADASKFIEAKIKFFYDAKKAQSKNQ